MKIRIGAAVLAVVALAAIYSLRSGPSVAPDFPTNTMIADQPEVIVDIPNGSTGSQIAQLLFDNKVIKSSEAFFRVAVGDKRSETIAPGNHRISQNISARQALEQLLDPNRIPNLIRIFEGGWKSEVVTALVAYGFSTKDISKAFTVAKLPQGFREVEGLLFPAQYSFAKGTSATAAVQAMIDRFTSEDSAQQILLGTKKFSAAQLLTIASIVQAEGDEKDFAKVARVIHNRLAIGMPLQMDSTVHYIKKVRGQIFLSTQSTLINSPYNTYRKYGLPPGPIGSPGVAAMTAALKPAVGDWLYFITVAPGDTRFTKSNDEFNSWKILYEKNRKAGAFK
ncbi:MAG: endolytic transglycosylase MltG [Actinobacteria bacterium]|nr:endolytic transglycosylase MltG [Actinomycetota bacterium]